MPYEKINLNCPGCAPQFKMTMTKADKPEEVRCMQCVTHWLRDRFITLYTGSGTVNPSHYPAVDLPPDRKPTAGDPYLGKCPHCMKDVRASQLSRTYPGEETLFHTECLIETMREIIEKRKEAETPAGLPGPAEVSSYISRLEDEAIELNAELVRWKNAGMEVLGMQIQSICKHEIDDERFKALIAACEVFTKMKKD